MRAARILIASTRAARGEYADRTGPVLRDWLASRGFDVPDPIVVADGREVGKAIRRALAEEPDVLITSGGTGITPTDSTPEQTAPHLTCELPGIIDAIRRRGEAAAPSAILSRGVAGMAGRTFVVNLPGSTGGVRDGIAVLDPVLDHVLDQRDGGGHAADPHPTPDTPHDPQEPTA